MPYNIPKELGGDSPENTAWMERCINAIEGINRRTKKPYTKEEKIAICKAMLMKNKPKEAAESELNLRINQLIVYRMKQGKTFLQAEHEIMSLLKKHNYDFNKVIDLLKG